MENRYHGFRQSDFSGVAVHWRTLPALEPLATSPAGDTPRRKRLSGPLLVTHVAFLHLAAVQLRARAVYRVVESASGHAPPCAYADAAGYHIADRQPKPAQPHLGRCQARAPGNPCRNLCRYAPSDAVGLHALGAGASSR